MSRRPAVAAPVAYLALLTVSLLWGLAFPLLRLTVQALGPALAMALRFSLAALLLLPWGLGRRPGPDVARRLGVLLGLLGAVVYGLVGRALQLSASPRVGFLMGTSVLMVPFANAVLGRGRLRLRHAVAALTSLVGLLTFSHFAPGQMAAHELWVLAAAGLFAASIILLDAATLARQLDLKRMLACQFATTAACCWGWLALHPGSLAGPAAGGLGGIGARLASASWQAYAALLFGALVPTILCQLLIGRYQKRLGPVVAATIFPLQSVFNYLSAVLLFGEQMDPQAALGGMLIFAATLMPGLGQLLQQARARPQGRHRAFYRGRRLQGR